jgi:prepilin-type N-terminal cleavage/methylation domain-containing protein
MTHAKRGLTLNEVLIVIAILGIITAILLPAVLRAKQRALLTPLRYPVDGVTGQSIPYRYSIYLIEGCEYIQWNGTLTHKGNCTNSIHSHNQ